MKRAALAIFLSLFAAANSFAEKIDGAVYIKDFNDIADYIRKNAKEGDIVLTMGAGNVVDIGGLLVD